MVHCWGLCGLHFYGIEDQRSHQKLQWVHPRLVQKTPSDMLKGHLTVLLPFANYVEHSEEGTSAYQLKNNKTFLVLAQIFELTTCFWSNLFGWSYNGLWTFLWFEAFWLIWQMVRLSQFSCSMGVWRLSPCKEAGPLQQPKPSTTTPRILGFNLGRLSIYTTSSALNWEKKFWGNVKIS